MAEQGSFSCSGCWRSVLLGQGRVAAVTTGSHGSSKQGMSTVGVCPLLWLEENVFAVQVPAVPSGKHAVFKSQHTATGHEQTRIGVAIDRLRLMLTCPRLIAATQLDPPLEPPFDLVKTWQPLDLASAMLPSRPCHCSPLKCIFRNIHHRWRSAPLALEAHPHKHTASRQPVPLTLEAQPHEHPTLEPLALNTKARLRWSSCLWTPPTHP